jgi:pimeloyl-ACP methyl ester carboxylesterase
VLVHRLFGDRSEFGPLIERLRRSEPRFSLLAFDLRGHGGSKEPSEKSKRKSGKDDKRELAGDVSAAIAHALEQSGNKARGVVLVGSSFGATLASLVAFEQAKVIALALISPGAAIRGVDLYRPYSEVRNLPTFIAGAEADTVAKDPLDALARMAQKPTLKRYPGARHGAQFLGEEQAALWKDLEVWLASVHAQAPAERRSLYYAPGKEPKAKKQPATPRARGGG